MLVGADELCCARGTGEGLKLRGAWSRTEGAQAAKGVSKGRVSMGTVLEPLLPRWVAHLLHQRGEGPPPQRWLGRLGGGTALRGAEHPGVGIPRMDGVPRMDAVPVIVRGVCQSHGAGAASCSPGVRRSEGGHGGREVTGERACRASLPAWSRAVRAGSDAGTWREEVWCVWGRRVGGEAASVRGRAQGGGWREAEQR